MQSDLRGRMKKSKESISRLFQQPVYSIPSSRKNIFSYFLFIFFLSILPLIASGIDILSAVDQPNATIGTESSNLDAYNIVVKDTVQIINEGHLEGIVAQSEQLWLKDKDQSETLILSAFEIIEQQPVSDSLQARIYHLYGKILIDKRQTKAGIDTLLECVKIKKALFGDNHTELANTYNYLGIATFHLRNYEEAMTYYKMAADVLNQNHQINRSLYDATLNLGIVSAVKGEYDLSYKFFNSALLIIDSISTSVDSLLIARFYLNYGHMATLMGKFDDAIQHFTLAELIYKEKYGPNFLSIAGININKGTNAFYTYDYSRAKLYYQESLNIFLQSDKPSIDVPKTYNNLSAVSIETGAFSESIEYCFLGLENKPDDYIKLLLFQNLAESYAALGNNERADFYYLAAIDLLRTEQLNPTKSISLYRSYADFLTGIGEYKKSKAFYDIALAKARRFNRSSSEVYASLLSQIGDYYRLSETQIDSALVFYDRSIVVWENIQSSKGNGQSGNFDDIRFLDAYLGKARVLIIQYEKDYKIGLLEDGCEIFKWTLDKVTAITRNLDRENQLLLNEKLEGVFDEALNIAFTLHKETSDIRYKEMAFEFAELSKSSVLLAAVQNNNALKTTGVPENIARSEQQLHEEINGMKKLLIDEQMKNRPSQKKISFFNSRLLQLMSSYDSLVKQIEQNNPRYFALKYDRSVIKISELSKQLKDDEVILEYVLTDSLLTLFSIGKDFNHFSQLKIDTVFNSALDELINVKNANLLQHSKQDMIKFIEDANVLWKYLIAPVYSQIQGKRLIIVPDGRLGYLSFDLLLQSSVIPEKLDYRLLPYLIKEFPVSYSYSSSLRYNSYFQAKENSTRTMIAFAPDNKYEKEGLPGADRLLNSTKEVTEVERIFRGKAYLGEKATKSKFLSEAANYKIIHLAMHTLINDSLPMFSELLFYDDRKGTTDTKLHTYEVFGLKLKADLVVLSACNTGSGRLQKGEGIMSLARGFIYAGVPSIVLTLWEAQDKATSEIMKLFYTNLTGLMTKDVALQKAKLDFLSNANQLKSHPYYWSSFIISGDAKQLTQNDKVSRSDWLSYSGILLLILIIGIVYYRKRKSAKETH